MNKVIELKKDKNLNHENIQYLTNDEMNKYGKIKTLDKAIEGQVLDELKLTKQCCRRHMLTHVDIFS
jgi:DNA-directed RNA polymerase I, II, and III subunit RPABC5